MWVFLALLALGSVGVLLDWYVNKSGWMPRTREVDVYFDSWTTGELKPCYSFSTPGKEGLKSLFCSNNQTTAMATALAHKYGGYAVDKDGARIDDEFHMFRVKFYGAVTTDRDRIWKCEREQASVSCKLQ